MSKAGIQSNRGDGYQTLVAFDWALTVLEDPAFAWLEVDAVQWSVDDVVVGKFDGTKICCQCKKNSPTFKAWSLADLSDELQKASKLLAGDSSAEVYFYSRTAFGDLAALREFSTSFADQSSYQANLTKGHGETDSALTALLGTHAPGLSSYQFLSHSRYENTSDLERMQALIMERLRRLATNSQAAFSALWTRLDLLGMRLTSDTHAAAQHRLTKEDLNSILVKSGAILTPPMNISQVIQSLTSTSAIGRDWSRDIGNLRLPRPIVGEILAAIEEGHRSILLTGTPGSGKTCVMLDLQEALEQLTQSRPSLVSLFIQSREFADLSSAQERQAHGLSMKWIEEVARVAEEAHVVVVIDSLDVLSIAREHSVLKYFLAQIDRLLLIPNVTVITACREFDRHFDSHIARRTWDKEFTCQPLSWEAEITPLLSQLGINASSIDKTTRELIANPRELALYVELAMRGGGFNIVTSQELALRYLASTFQDNISLGDDAQIAVESIAAEMMRVRSLTLPRQRFPGSKNVLWALLSNKILHETTDGKLTFGHQTLLDVLVVSGAVRRGLTLNDFIHELPSVPFVRPSIRSFIEQLATLERSNTRKQMRTVLTGNTPFHIRRLVAETLAERAPEDGDWPLIRDLHRGHRDVFQVIYAHGDSIEWHRFWLKHLVPTLKDARDVNGILTHVNRIHTWRKEDPDGVFGLWNEVFSLDWIDKAQLSGRLEYSFSHIEQNESRWVAPLLVRLLDVPQQFTTTLGKPLAACVQAGEISDDVLWRYIIGNSNSSGVRKAHSINKFQCNPHEFGAGSDNFLADRMKQSTQLLDLAISYVEAWDQNNVGESDLSFTTSSHGLLRHTSYNDSHTKLDIRHVDSERTLLNTIEAAIKHHAGNHSAWWQSNRDRLAFSIEGALRHFAILACGAAPETNIELVSRMLTDHAFLASPLSYELGTLMHDAFPYLEIKDQDAVQDTILSLWSDVQDEPHFKARQREKAQFIAAIPCYLRSVSAQALLDEVQSSVWPYVRQPFIHMWGGMVGAPFSFEVFLSSSDEGVLRLLRHYTGYDRERFGDDMLGGAELVGSELREAASRDPSRFMGLLRDHWSCLPARFCDEIMNGVAKNLAHRFGNLQADTNWQPTESPEGSALAADVLDELERHPNHWYHNRSASDALQGCAHVCTAQTDLKRLIFLAIGFSTLRDQTTSSSHSRDRSDLMTTGINMARGRAMESLIITANNLCTRKDEWPELLEPALRHFARDGHPAVRALLLQRLPYLQSQRFDLGWDLFYLAIESDNEGLWAIAESCLYYALHEHFDIVGPLLERIRSEEKTDGHETWGRISALSVLIGHLDLPAFLLQLADLGSEAWTGAMSVWTHPSNFQQYRIPCLAGIEAAIGPQNTSANEVVTQLNDLFRNSAPPLTIPTSLIQRFFELLVLHEPSSRSDIYGFDKWLNLSAVNDPLSALDATEHYLAFLKHARPYHYDTDNNLTQLLTCLFAQAEEQEESDSGTMLQRVVAIQDSMLALGIEGVVKWLKAAERP